jgi:N-methylhydantoinase A/oxoprolinase/acetone carboxylase beta subunit
MRRIGIDVGGTNTDAVLLEDRRVVYAVKTPTMPDVSKGIVATLGRLAADPAIGRTAVDGVVIGTTHFVNAAVQREGLVPVAAVRIGLPAAASLPPFCDWPEDLAALVRGEVFMLEGGHDYDGRPIVAFDERGMRRAARRIRRSGIRTVAIAAIFSPLDPSCEDRAAEILREECPEAAVTCSAISAALASSNARTQPS